ncbi:MAG: DUF3795 domain-containing protein [Thermodesulfobacteriota bacterium]
MKPEDIAPCGMNCGICYAYLRVKNQCPGCRTFAAEEPVSIARCKIRNCELVKQGKVKFCFECQTFPCKNLKNLDKRYRTKYGMSEVENLEYIRENGIEKFIRNEKKRWACPQCGGTMCVHKKRCSKCGE